MMNEIKNVLSKSFKHVKINERWVKEFNEYLYGIFVKNEEHVEFFGSVLVGVNKIVFDGGDENYFWDILMETDQAEVDGELKALKVIDPSWKVASNPTNNALAYCMHLVLKSNLSNKLKESTIVNILVLLQFKFITSIFKNDWEHGANRDISLLTYNKLSKRFILRQVDSWREFFYLRARDMYHSKDQRKPMMKILAAFSDDVEVLRTFTGIQTNLRGMMTDYNQEYYRMHGEGAKLGLSTQLSKDAEGNDGFSDNVNNVSRYRNYLVEMVNQESSFINEDMLSVITKTGNGRYKPIRKTLAHISSNYGERRHEHLTDFVDNALVFGLSKIAESDKDIRNVGDLFELLLGSFSSSRSLDPTLEKLKSGGIKVINDALGNKLFNNTITLTRTLVLIYIVIRTILSNR